MEEKRNFYEIVEGICAKDNRYKADSYEFIMQALYFTQKRIKRKGHISGLELSEGIRDFAIEQYGPMAKTVLNQWGINKTEDFGNIVFNMIDQALLSKTDSDCRDDFKDIYNFEDAFANILRDSVIKDIGQDNAT